MTGLAQPSRPDAPYYRSTYLAGLLIFLISAARTIADEDTTRPGLVAALLGIFFVLYFSQPAISRRFPGYPKLYFLLQYVVVQTIGLQSDDDPWGLLFIVLGLQLVAECSRREIMAWGSLFVASGMITLMATMGWITGLGHSLTHIAGGALLISFDALYRQAEAARRESQRLLAELQQAHQTLKEYAAQAEALAAAQERDRLTRTLHDSVGQMIFSINLNAEAARLLLQKDPGRVSEQLDRLQEQTGSALSQMRALIGQWRGG